MSPPASTRRLRHCPYFDSGIQGPDAATRVRQLSQLLRCRGVAIRTVPHTLGTAFEDPGRYGAVQLELFGTDETDFLNYVRTISVTHDGSKWRFDANGEIQPFETSAAYSARRVRDRFTSEMLERYCEALGLRPFDEDFYLADARRIESPVDLPAEAKSMSLEETQQWLGIVPGAADSVP